MSKSYNYNFNWVNEFKIGNKSAKFKLDIINDRDSAVAVVEGMTRSGKKVSETIVYYPEDVSVDYSYLRLRLIKSK